MNAGVKGHLNGLVKEISSLIGHAKPASVITSCWTKNSEDVDVALKVLGAVSYTARQQFTRVPPDGVCVRVQRNR